MRYVPKAVPGFQPPGIVVPEALRSQQGRGVLGVLGRARLLDWAGADC